jgi:hypothetical protein
LGFELDKKISTPKQLSPPVKLVLLYKLMILLLDKDTISNLKAKKNNKD